MSYYFVIVSPTDKPLFDLTFGTSKAGGDGVARFRNAETSRYMNQFITHASLDIVEEVQWLNSNMSETSKLFPRETILTLYCQVPETYRYLSSNECPCQLFFNRYQCTPLASAPTHRDAVSIHRKPYIHHLLHIHPAQPDQPADRRGHQTVHE